MLANFRLAMRYEQPRGYRRSLYLLPVLMLIAVVPSSAITYLLYIQAKTDYVEQLSIRLNNLAMDRELATRLLIEHQAASLGKLAEDPEVRRLAKALKAGNQEIPSDALDRIAKPGSVFGGLLLMDIRSGRHQLAGTFPKAFLQRGVPELKENHEPSMLVIEAMPNGERLFLLGRQLDAATARPYRGVVLLALSDFTRLDDLFVDRSALGATGEAFFADKQGIPLTPLRYIDSEEARHPISVEAMQDCLKGTAKSFVLTPDSVGVPTVVSYRPVQGYGGCVMVHLRHAEVLAHIASMRNRMIASVALMVVLVSVLAAIVTRKVLKTEKLLQSLASTDSLTGVTNRHHFMELLEQELNRSRRFAQTACLLMLDIDHFKSINDTYGHPAGDSVLKHFASLIGQNLRSIDRLGRIGGEEFCILLPNTRLAGARQFAERLCEVVATTPATIDTTTISYTVSIGVTEFAQDEAKGKEVIQRADAALYRAKREGRNRAVA